MKWISLQNLIGGMALGFHKQFGAPTAIITNGIPNDKYYIDYVNKVKNLNVPVIECSKDYELDENLIPHDIDIVAMTPFCSGLTLFNTYCLANGTLGSCDLKTNQNIFNTLKLAFKIRPKIIAFENSDNLVFKIGIQMRNALEKIASDNGYTVQYILTNTFLHGIPQRRRRAFMIFYRDTNPAVFEFEKLPRKTYKEFFDDFPDYGDPIPLPTEFFLECALHISGAKNIYDLYEKTGKTKPLKSLTYCTEHMKESLDYINSLYSKYNDEDNIKKIDKSIRILKHIQTKFDAGKGFFDFSPIITKDFCPGLIGKNLKVLHPKYNRFLNIREIARLFAFPDDYVFPDNKHYLDLTRNVPVCTSNYIARQLDKYLKNELSISREPLLFQNNIKQKNFTTI